VGPGGEAKPCPGRGEELAGPGGVRTPASDPGEFGGKSCACQPWPDPELQLPDPTLPKSSHPPPSLLG
jgi:hypothetical protein